MTSLNLVSKVGCGDACNDILCSRDKTLLLLRLFQSVLSKARTAGFIVVSPENHNKVSRLIFQDFTRILDSFAYLLRVSVSFIECKLW